MASGGSRVLIAAKVTEIGEGPFCYPACVQCFCKLVEDDGAKRCLKCGHVYKAKDVHYRFRLSAAITDYSSVAYISAFGGMLDDFFGTSASHFQRIASQTSQDCQSGIHELVHHAVEQTFVGQNLLFGLKVPSTFFRDRCSQAAKGHVLLSDIPCNTHTTESQTQKGQSFKSSLIAFQVLWQDKKLRGTNTVVENLKFLSSQVGTVSNSSFNLQCDKENKALTCNHTKFDSISTGSQVQVSQGELSEFALSESSQSSLEESSVRLSCDNSIQRIKFASCEKHELIMKPGPEERESQPLTDVSQEVNYTPERFTGGETKLRRSKRLAIKKNNNNSWTHSVCGLRKDSKSKDDGQKLHKNLPNVSWWIRKHERLSSSTQISVCAQSHSKSFASEDTFSQTTGTSISSCLPQFEGNNNIDAKEKPETLCGKLSFVEIPRGGLRNDTSVNSSLLFEVYNDQDHIFKNDFIQVKVDSPNNLSVINLTNSRTSSFFHSSQPDNSISDMDLTENITFYKPNNPQSIVLAQDLSLRQTSFMRAKSWMDKEPTGENLKLFSHEEECYEMPESEDFYAFLHAAGDVSLSGQESKQSCDKTLGLQDWETTKEGLQISTNTMHSDISSSHIEMQEPQSHSLHNINKVKSSKTDSHAVSSASPSGGPSQFNDEIICRPEPLCKTLNSEEDLDTEEIICSNGVYSPSLNVSLDMFADYCADNELTPIRPVLCSKNVGSFQNNSERLKVKFKKGRSSFFRSDTADGGKKKVRFCTKRYEVDYNDIEALSLIPVPQFKGQIKSCLKKGEALSCARGKRHRGRSSSRKSEFITSPIKSTYLMTESKISKQDNESLSFCGSQELFSSQETDQSDKEVITSEKVTDSSICDSQDLFSSPSQNSLGYESKEVLALSSTKCHDTTPKHKGTCTGQHSTCLNPIQRKSFLRLRQRELTDSGEYAFYASENMNYSLDLFSPSQSSNHPEGISRNYLLEHNPYFVKENETPDLFSE